MSEETFEQKIRRLMDLALVDKSSLTPDDIEFLKARRSYLTEEELEYMADKFGALPVGDANPEELTNAQLIEKLTELGVPIPKKYKKSDLKALLDQKMTELETPADEA